MNHTEVYEGEVLITLTPKNIGKWSFSQLGVEEKVAINGGFLRLVFELNEFQDHAYFAVPTIELNYDTKVGETHWVCEFNGETILDKVDNYGTSTVLLLDRKKMSDLEQHHENRLIIHAEFPELATLLLDKCTVNLFK